MITQSPNPPSVINTNSLSPQTQLPVTVSNTSAASLPQPRGSLNSLHDKTNKTELNEKESKQSVEEKKEELSEDDAELIRQINDPSVDEIYIGENSTNIKTINTKRITPDLALKIITTKRTLELMNPDITGDAETILTALATAAQEATRQNKKCTLVTIP